MNRAGLIIALVIAAAVGIVFAVHPELDLRLAAPFYEIMYGPNKFGSRVDPPLMFTRDAILWLVEIVAIVSLLALIVKLILPRRGMLIEARAILFLLGTLALAPGIVTNLTLKDHWSRPRPIDVREFGGQEHFVPWWDPRGDCKSNCSFVSGDVSAAFWLVAPAALTPMPWRIAAYAGALALGSLMGILRMAAGGHFFTDAAFAGIFTFLIVWLAYALIYRWPRTRLDERELEKALGRLTRPAYDAVTGLFADKPRRKRPKSSGKKPARR